MRIVSRFMEIHEGTSFTHVGVKYNDGESKTIRVRIDEDLRSYRKRLFKVGVVLRALQRRANGSTGVDQ